VLRTASRPKVASSEPWWAEALAELFGVSVAFAADLRRLIDDPSCWLLSDRTEIRVIRVPPGPARGNADAMLLRAAPGVRVPEHVHQREEHTLVLRGAFEENHAGVVDAGHLLVKPPGTSHSLRVVGAEECICAVLWIRP
jgi:anti-sigma factor ChrR (cupin superfamily)